MSENIAGYELVFLNKKKLSEIRNIENPEIEFCIDNRIIISKGNDMLSSSIPEGAESFFPISSQKKVYLSNDNKLLLSIVKKIIKQ